MDGYFRAVSGLYCRPRETADDKTEDSAAQGPSPNSVYVSSAYNSTQYGTLDLLLSPLRRPHILGVSLLH